MKRPRLTLKRRLQWSVSASPSDLPTTLRDQLRQSDAGLAIESQRTGMERQDTVVGGVGRSCAHSSRIDFGFGIGCRQDRLGDRVGGLVWEVLVGDHEIPGGEAFDLGG